MEQKRDVVFIHGVEIGSNADIGDYSRRMRDAVEADANLTWSDAKWKNAYWADVAERYTDGWEFLAEKAMLLFGGRLAVTSKYVGDIFDLVGDVFVYKSSRAAKEVRQAVKSTQETAANCILVAHSLGSVIAYDLLREYVEEGRFGGARDEWPFRAMITFGSPLNLSMFLNQRRRLLNGPISDWFYWYNYSDKNDPVVTGNVFGLPEQPLLFEAYQDQHEKLVIKDRYANSGFHLGAHTSYWSHPTLAMRLAQMVTT